MDKKIYCIRFRIAGCEISSSFYYPCEYVTDLVKFLSKLNDCFEIVDLSVYLQND